MDSVSFIDSERNCAGKGETSSAMNATFARRLSFRVIGTMFPLELYAPASNVASLIENCSFQVLLAALF